MSLLSLVKNFAFTAPKLVRSTSVGGRPAFALPSPKRSFGFAQAGKAPAGKPPAVKTSLAGPMIAWSGVGQPKWTPRRYESFAEEGFRKNVIAYRCVMQIATASAAIPWLLYDEEGQEVEQHPLLTLLRHPNPLQDGVTFLESIYAYLEIAGNAYIEAVPPRDSAAPVELYVLRPDRMKVIPGPAGLPQGYQYSVNGQVTNWPADPITGSSAILHLKRFHPLDDWYGMPPMEAALVSIDQHNAAGAWNQALLNQGARPSGALVYAPKDGPNTLTDDQVERLREELGQLYQGSRNAGRPLILEGGLDWREMSLSPKDMDWLAGRDTAARDIAQAFGVPAQLVGIPGSQTYANMSEARMAFYEETILPLVTRVIAGVDHWLTPMFDEDLELDFDPDAISALTPRRDAQWSKLQNAGFLTRNEKREAAGYGPVPGGDADDDGSDSDDPDPVFDSVFSPANDAEAEEAQVTWLRPKFNPYHDELGRFTTGPGSESDDKPDDSGDTGASESGNPNDGGMRVVQEDIIPEGTLDESTPEVPGSASTIKPPFEKFPADPTQPPAPGFQWEGNGPPGSSQGNWHNPDTEENLHPDMNHPPPQGPHWDYDAPDGNSYRLYPDGRIELKPVIVLTT